MLACEVVEVRIKCVLISFGVTVWKNVLAPQVKYDQRSITLTHALKRCLYWVRGVYVGYTVDTRHKKLTHSASGYERFRDKSTDSQVFLKDQCSGVSFVIYFFTGTWGVVFCTYSHIY